MWTPMPTVLTIHDMLYWSHPEFMVTPFYTRPVMWMERRGAANATRIITDSQVSADEIVRFLDYPRERLHVVPLAATSHRYADTLVRDRENLLIASGQRRRYKNWDGLIRALVLVDEAVRPRLVVTGSSDPATDPLLPVIADAGLHDWVEVRGWVGEQELTDLYRRARALVMPTLCEGFGLPVLEAMASGLPVLASDIPVLREVGGDAALWFDPYDPASIAESMTVAATQPERLEALAELGMGQAARFSWRRTADETLAVFHAVLEQSAAERVASQRRH
jgi:glycosyltransferase involved in cell wall biosynthesis